MNFCTDTDLLLIEPRLFTHAAPVATTRLAGIGEVVDSFFSFVSRVPAEGLPQVGDVLLLLLPEEFPLAVVSVNAFGVGIELPTPTFYDSPSAAPGVPQETNTSYIVRTFPQRAAANDLIASALSLLTSQPTPTILNPQALRRPVALMTLGMIYRSLSHTDRSFLEPTSGQITIPSPTHWRRAAEYYEAQLRTTLRHARVELDTDNDGQPNIIKRLAEVLLVRA